MRQAFSVLVIIGASGVGKSTAAAELGRRCGIPWIQVDDLRLALQYSDVTLPERTDDLYYFERIADVWSRTPAELRQAFINVAEVMVPAVRVTIHSHVITGAPMIIEGDGILPALVTDPILKPLVENGIIRFCAIATPDVDELVMNMLSRGRGIDPNHPDRPRQQAIANRAFGLWLEGEASRLGIPIVDSRPYDSLPDRIIAAMT